MPILTVTSRKCWIQPCRMFCCNFHSSQNACLWISYEIDHQSGSMGMQPVHRRTSHLVWWCSVVVLNFLMNLSLNLYFISEVRWGKGTCMWEHMCNVCLPLIAAAFSNSGVPKVAEIQQDSKQIQDVSCLRLSKQGSQQPWEPTFSIWPEFASNADRRQRCSKKHKWPRNPIVSFLIQGTSLHEPTIHSRNDDTEGKGEMG